MEFLNIVELCVNDEALEHFTAFAESRCVYRRRSTLMAKFKSDIKKTGLIKYQTFSARGDANLSGWIANSAKIDVNTITIMVAWDMASPYDIRFRCKGTSYSMNMLNPTANLKMFISEIFRENTPPS